MQLNCKAAHFFHSLAVFVQIYIRNSREWLYYCCAKILFILTDSGYNLPKVTVCTHLLQEYVYGEKDITGVPSKTLPEPVRRFIEDAYMCVYIDPEGVMYQ